MRTPGAEHLIRQRIKAIARWLPAARDGDATSLHQARVATRRMREAIPLVARGAKAQKLARSVRRLTRALGPVRELDVELAILDELDIGPTAPRHGIQRLRAMIVDDRRQLGSELRDHITDFDLETLLKKSVAAARKADGAATRRDPRHAAMTRARIARRAQSLEAAMEDAAGLYLPDRLHEVRIAVKKLRYALELSQGATSPRGVARLRLLKATQDLLGRMHDLEVLIARTRSIQSSPGASSLKVSGDLDRLVRRLETECRQLHGHYVAGRRDLLTLCHRLIAVAERDGRSRSTAA
jgi:CHAD domain-containing protein